VQNFNFLIFFIGKPIIIVVGRYAIIGGRNQQIEVQHKENGGRTYSQNQQTT